MQCASQCQGYIILDEEGLVSPRIGLEYCRTGSLCMGSLRNGSLQKEVSVLITSLSTFVKVKEEGNIAGESDDSIAIYLT